MEISDCRRRAPRKPGHRVSALTTDERHSIVVRSLRITGMISSLVFDAPEEWVRPICLSGHRASPSFTLSYDRERRGLDASLQTKLTLHDISRDILDLLRAEGLQHVVATVAIWKGSAHE